MSERDPAQRRAAAIVYDPETDSAPRVVAKGRGFIADQIVERAREAGVPIQQSSDLASLLTAVELDASVPPALYLAVAEVLAWVYRLEQAKKAAARPRPRPARASNRP